MYKDVLPACTSVTTWVHGACGSQRALCPQELDSQTVVSRQLGTVIPRPWKSSNGSYLLVHLSSPSIQLLKLLHRMVHWYILLHLWYNPFCLTQIFPSQIDVPSLPLLGRNHEMQIEAILWLEVCLSRDTHMVQCFFKKKFCLHFYLCVCMCVSVSICHMYAGLMEDRRR